MGGCRLLPRTCVPANEYVPTVQESEDEQVVRDFVVQVWNWQPVPSDEYYYLPPGLRTALGQFVDPALRRYRRAYSGTGTPGTVRWGDGVYGLGGCVRRLREQCPSLNVQVEDLFSLGNRVMAVLSLTGADPRPSGGLFQREASVMYRLTGAAGSRKIVEDWAISDGFSVE